MRAGALLVCASLATCLGAQSIEEKKCPSEAVLKVKEKCQVGKQWMDCLKLECCEGYVYMAGRCVPEDVDPCSLGICEQKCSVQNQRVVCTCFPGYKYNAENQRNHIRPLCVDINECETSNAGCEHRCVNEEGSYSCVCNEGFQLSADNHTCSPTNLVNVTTEVPEGNMDLFPPDTDNMFDFKGEESAYKNHVTYNLIDNNRETSQENFCLCERGPIGPPGAPGKDGVRGPPGQRGSRGPKGPRGSFDFLLLLLADLRHDINNLESKVYKEGDYPEKFNIQKAWKKQKARNRAQERSSAGELGAAYAIPKVEVTTDGSTGDISRPRPGSEEFEKLKGELRNIDDLLRNDGTVEDEQEMFRKLAKYHVVTNWKEEEEEADDEGDYDYNFKDPI